jgi:UTP-glucose-1-phosphate uridylyltransferase
MDKYIEGFSVPPDRTKPWGTAHAILCARDAVKEPFAVINADDFYGSDAFRKAQNFLLHDCR